MPGEIRGMVFHDRNGDGVRDAGETGLQYQQIALLTGSQPLEVATTDYGGEYVFSNLVPGEVHGTRQPRWPHRNLQRWSLLVQPVSEQLLR